jgi:hypothetical protein
MAGKKSVNHDDDAAAIKVLQRLARAGEGASVTAADVRVVAQAIDRWAAAGIGDGAVDLTEKDILFEALMARIDGWQRHRAGSRVFLAAVMRDPCLWSVAGPMMAAAMGRVAVLVGGKPGDPIKTLLIAGCYLAALRVWMNDNTPDCAATMHELDRRLGQMAIVS